MIEMSSTDTLHNASLRYDIAKRLHTDDRDQVTFSYQQTETLLSFTSHMAVVSEKAVEIGFLYDRESRRTTYI